MSISKKALLAVTLAGLSASAFADSALAPYSLIPNHRFDKPMFSAMTLPRQADSRNFDIFAENQSVKSDALTRAESDPGNSFNGVPEYSEITTPVGRFFVTMDYEIEENYVNEYYTEKIITGFNLTFYDGQFKEVGSIKDKIEFDSAKGETATAHCIVDNYASQHFFNDDDNIEVMVYLGIKTGPNFDYHPNFYEKVYSLGGEKNEEGYDKCIYTMEGRLVDTISNGTEEGTYLTFVNDIYYSAKDYPDPVARAKATTTKVSIYGYGATGTPELVMEKDIKMVSYPGDTTDSPYLISKNVNGTSYMVFSFYELPYFVNPLGGAEDESATTNNNFVIETWKLGAEPQPVTTTKIKVEIPFNPDKLMYAFYSIGDLTWKGDIDMTYNGTPESPAYIVKTDVVAASDLESVASSYDLYKADGTLDHNIANNVENFIQLSSAGSDEPHIMFITVDDNGDYIFKFVDLYSGNIAMTIPQIYDGEPLMASAERIKDGNEYKYAILLQNDYVDDDYVVFKRLAWFDQKGNLDHIDKIHIGKDVQASTLNMQASVLNPYLFDDDPEMEYAVLVKRTYDATVRNEFIIVDHTGEWYAHFTADDGKGDPYMLTVVPNGNGGTLYMTYNDGVNYNMDVYSLPFENLGVESIIGESANAYYNGTAIVAPGSSIVLFNISGVKAAAGKEYVETVSLPKGVYVAVITESNGKKSAFKFTK
ncbi:MAG: hypothetical protein J1D77_00145 [Muribaculaceae bacterium]|nr:hypothetical protein [Muribaculaceae bacterium]